MARRLNPRRPGTLKRSSLTFVATWAANAALAVLVLAGAAGSAAADECDAQHLAVAAPSRPADDLARDPLRKPAEVLCHFGIDAGDHVLDLFSGSGYYTEIISNLVGPSGSVVAHNNKAYLGFQKDQIAARYNDGRLANTRQLHAEADTLRLRANTFDAALMILAYHDIYYVTDDGSWPTIDGPRLLREIMKGLKPGGVLGVVDHTAAPGSPVSTGTSLHRIDPAVLKAQIEAAGFVFVGESDALRNAADDHTKPMFDEAVRGKTDRVIYKFRKPG